MENACKISYNSKYVKGDSLELFADIFRHRKYLWLGPRAYPSTLADLKISSLEVAKDLEMKGMDPNELVISFTGSGEEFYSIAASFALKKMGYIVFPEGILEAPIGGVPDLIAVKLGNIQKNLVEEGVISGGAFLSEFELFNLFKEGQKVTSSFEEEAIVVEVESARINASTGRAQLREKYLPYGCFNAGYLACPKRCDDKEDEIGTITWDEEGREVIYKATRDYGKKERVNEILEFAKKLVLYTYLKNLPIRHLEKMFGQASLAKIIDQVIKM